MSLEPLVPSLAQRPHDEDEQGTSSAAGWLSARCAARKARQLQAAGSACTRRGRSGEAALWRGAVATRAFTASTRSCVSFRPSLSNASHVAGCIGDTQQALPSIPTAEPAWLSPCALKVLAASYTLRAYDCCSGAVHQRRTLGRGIRMRQRSSPTSAKKCWATTTRSTSSSARRLLRLHRAAGVLLAPLRV